MEPINRNATRILGAPKDWDASKNGPCVGLPIVDAHGHMYSYWRPSWRERARILFGSPVRLVIAGHSHPPVAIEARHD